MQPLVTRVLARSRARLLGGDTHVPDKVLSIVGLGVIAANLVSTAHVLNPATA
jgi:hypothetical protein